MLMFRGLPGRKYASNTHASSLLGVISASYVFPRAPSTQTYLLWGLHYLSRTYFGVFGAPGLGPLQDSRKSGHPTAALRAFFSSLG